MLALRVHLKDADQECSIAGKVVRFGGSYVEAFVSDQTTMSVRDTLGEKEIWIGEDADPLPAGGAAHMVDYRSFLDYEGIKILVHRVDGRPVIEIVRTAEGGCPVYVAADRGTLVASWKFEDAVQARSHPKPNVEACRIYLKHGQCQVRDMIIDLNDFEAPSFEPPPFASLQVEECTFTPFDDMYRLPCVYAVDAHPAKDIDLVITGIGGDELTMENTFFRQEWEVSGSICTSAVVSAVGRADMFMRRGIWPVHPLVNQSVVDFCRALPKKMRGGRLLNLLALARSGLSDGFLFPRYYEHYGNVIQREAALFDFDSALAESVVADYGITEFSPLLESAREATLRGFTYELITELYLLLKLEAVLRRYVG